MKTVNKFISVLTVRIKYTLIGRNMRETKLFIQYRSIINYYLIKINCHKILFFALINMKFCHHLVCDV